MHILIAHETIALNIRALIQFERAEIEDDTTDLLRTLASSLAPLNTRIETALSDGTLSPIPTDDLVQELIPLFVGDDAEYESQSEIEGSRDENAFRYDYSLEHYVMNAERLRGLMDGDIEEEDFDELVEQTPLYPQTTNFYAKAMFAAYLQS